MTSSRDANHSAPSPSDQFRTTPRWRSGYEPEDVDRFVAAIAAELRRLEEAQATAEREVGRLRNYFRSHGIEA